MNGGSSRWKVAAFWLLLIVISVGLVEVALHVLCALSPRAEALLTSRTGLSIPDEKLGWRPNPRFPEHDAKGWRNKEVVDRPAVVALGDSMTYGVWAKREDAWPQQLERLGGLKTYNMAFSGYDPTKYLLMVDEALELHPKLVVATVYTGNDLWEAYSAVYTENQLRELRTTDETLLREFSARDSEVPVEQVSHQLFEPQRGLKDLLEAHSKIYALLWLAKAILIPDYTWPWFWIKFRASRFPPWEVFEEGNIHTVLTPAYRFLALDQADPRIREGLRLSLAALKQSNDRLKAAGVRFLVLLLPTKEFALAPFLADTRLKNPDRYKRLVDNEKRVWATTREYLLTNGIPFIDALPELRRSVRSGKNPFHINQDGHPSTEGHRAIAAGVLSEMRKERLLEPQSPPSR